MSREAFEAAFKERLRWSGVDFAVDQAGTYVDDDTLKAYCGWSARDAELAAKDARIKDLEAVCRWYISRMPQGHPVKGIDDLIERVRKEEALR